MATQTGIKTPGTIWAKLIERQAEQSRKPEGRGDGFVYFVGSRSSGKSTLLNRFLYPNRAEVPKPSEGLEYTYARKPSNYDHEKKDLAHIWEVGGSQEFAEETAQGDTIFLTAKQVLTGVVVIVVDLSDPASVMPTLMYWLEQVKRKLGSTYEKFEKKGYQLPEQLRQRAKKTLFSQNEDKDSVWHSGIAIVIAACKYDAFRDQDSELKKVMSRALRYIAHSHGAFLTYLGGLQAGADPTSAQEDKALLENFARLMNHLIFTGLEKKPALKLNPCLDHNGPIMVPAGVDKFRDVGRPRGPADGSNVPAGMQEWRELVEKMFGPARPDMLGMGGRRAAKFEVPEQYKDEEIDSVRDRKQQELEAYRRETEAAKENAKKKLAQAKAVQQGGGREAGGGSTSPDKRAARQSGAGEGDAAATGRKAAPKASPRAAAAAAAP